MIEEVRRLVDLQSKELVDFGITKEDFAAWAALPTTQNVMRALHHHRQQLSETLAVGETLNPSIDETVQHTNRLVGVLAGLDVLLRLEYVEDEEDETEGGESESTTS